MILSPLEEAKQRVLDTALAWVRLLESKEAGEPSAWLAEARAYEAHLDACRELRSARLRLLAAHTPVSDEHVDDLPAIRTYIDERLPGEAR